MLANDFFQNDLYSLSNRVLFSLERTGIAHRKYLEVTRTIDKTSYKQFIMEEIVLYPYIIMDNGVFLL
jgi:hypothetical protein